MKKHILTLASVLLLSLSAFAQKGMTQLEQLPAKAQEFVNEFFKEHQIKYILTDREFADTEYEVRFEDGIEIEFNAKGEWTDISSKNDCLPTGFILKEILDYINTNHKGMCITDIEKEFRRIKVELNDHLEIEFNNKGEFITYDD